MKEESIIVYVYRGPDQEVPWREIKRAIAAQLGPNAVLALTITCKAIEKAALVSEETAEESCAAAELRAPITIADVAREANVSNSTVSKVLNDYTTVSRKTRARVEDAVRRMDYRPNEAARSMVRSRLTKQSVFAIADAPLFRDEAKRD